MTATHLTVTGSHSVRHHIVFTAPDDRPIVILMRGDTRAAFKQVIVEVIADADGSAEPLKTSMTGSGYALREDDTITGSPRTLDGGNLNRLPSFLREAILAEVEKRGVTGLREDADRVGAMRSDRTFDKHANVSQVVARG
jgi:hypothetical protein